MRVIVPFDAREPKTRLSGLLSADERAAFARAMLEDVVATVEAAGGRPEVLATAPVETPAPVTVDDRPLTPAVNAALPGTDVPTAVVMADLAVATADALESLFDRGESGVVAIAPGRGGGTNALVVGHPEFRVDYHGCSFRDHVEGARAVGATVRTVDSHRLATDVDDPADVLEVLLHGDGPAREWLRAAGFRITVENESPRLRRV